MGILFMAFMVLTSLRYASYKSHEDDLRAKKKDEAIKVEALGGGGTGEMASAQGVAEIRSIETREPITAGSIDLGKRLRPNFRQGKVVLFAASISEGIGEPPHWQAVRVV